MCSLTCVIFSVRVNGLVERLHAEKCGVQCGDHLVPGLLFADDIHLWLPLTNQG